MVQIYAMGLIFSSLMLLVIPGLIFNEMSASGLDNQFSLTCPGFHDGYQDFTCQNQYGSGCAIDAGSCSLNGTKISFLNSQSPFTALLGGNIFSAFNTLNSNGNAPHGPFDSSGGGAYYPANCVVQNQGDSNTNMTTNLFAGLITSCTQANPDGSNTSKAQTFTFTNWNGLQHKVLPAIVDADYTGASVAGTSYCIPVGCVLGSPFITQNDVQVIQITTDVAGGVASTGSVADTGLSVWTMQDSVTQTCGGGGADTCWVGTFTSTYEAASGFNQYTITLSLSAKSSAWLTSCTNCVLSGLVVKHAGSASNSVASVASFSPPTSGLVMATAVIDGASTAGSPWTADAGFKLIPIANGGSFLSPGQGTFSAPYSGGATTAFIVNSAGTGWAEDVIAMGPTPLNSTVGSQTIPFYSVALNATYAVTCYNQGFYYVTNHPTVGYATDGCDYYNPTVYPPPISPNTTPVWSFLIAIPASQAPTGLMTANMPLGYYHIQVFVQPENWDTQFCTNSFFGLDTYYQSQQCINMETWFVTPQNSGLQAGFLTPLLTIIVGLILFLIGCGINLQAGGSIFGNGSSLGAGVNAQGTRLAQVLGLTLVFYTPLYSEFSSWFTQGILPLGLDGNISAIATGSGIMAFIITGLLFVGVAWQALSFGGDA